MSQRFLPTQRFYTELREDDVLLGRGTGPNDFEGNIRYRKMVKAAIAGVPPEVFSSSKAALSRKIVDEITDKGGRFVRKLSAEEAAELQECLRDGIHKTELAHIIAQKTPIYIDVAREVAIEKTKQGFRHQTRSKRSRVTSDDSKTHLRTRTQPNQEVYGTKSESNERQSHHPLLRIPSMLTSTPTIAAPVHVPPTLSANVAANSSALQQALLLLGQGALLQPQTVPPATRLPGVASNQLGGLPPHIYQLLLQQQSLPIQQPSLLPLQLTLATLRQQEQTHQQQQQAINLAAMLLTGGQRTMASTQLAQQINQLQTANASSGVLQPPALATDSAAPAAAANSTRKIDPAILSANLLLQVQECRRAIGASISSLAPPGPRQDGPTGSGSSTEDDEEAPDTKPRASLPVVSSETKRKSNDANEQKTHNKPAPLKKRRKS